MTEEINYIDENSGDENLNVTFYKAVNEEGVELDYVRVAIPGNAFTVIEEPANERYQQRFAKQWQAYKGVQEMTGTPIEEWDIPEPMIKEFKKQEFNFIEQVANAPDALLLNIMGYHSWREKARAYINANKVTPEKVINAQQQQIADLQAQLSALTELVTQPKRGRQVAVET